MEPLSAPESVTITGGPHPYPGACFYPGKNEETPKILESRHSGTLMFYPRAKSTSNKQNIAPIRPPSARRGPVRK